jgi:hypothetical protein
MAGGLYDVTISVLDPDHMESNNSVVGSQWYAHNCTYRPQDFARWSCHEGIFYSTFHSS